MAFSRLAITTTCPTIVLRATNLGASGTSGPKVTFSAPFYSTPAIAITADSMATGDYYNPERQIGVRVLYAVLQLRRHAHCENDGLDRERLLVGKV